MTKIVNNDILLFQIFLEINFKNRLKVLLSQTSFSGFKYECFKAFGNLSKTSRKSGSGSKIHHNKYIAIGTNENPDKTTLKLKANILNNIKTTTPINPPLQLELLPTCFVVSKPKAAKIMTPTTIK